MVNWLLQKIIGTHNERVLKKLTPVVDQINQLEPQIQKLSDGELRAKTDEFRAKIKQSLAEHVFITPATPEWYDIGHDERARLKKQRRAIQQKALDAVLPEAFAVVREAARRTVAMRHFDVQLIGGMVLHQGTIAEMSTGEGKTLVATLAAYLNALTGRGVHIVTVNDYLARRDARWMGPIYHSLGLTIGVIQGVDVSERRRDESLSFLYDPAFTQTSDRFLHLRPCTRKEAYAADITYGQNNEFGFDYLRDNMRFRREDLTQGEYHFAIVDEVDSILIDEARTPLIISGPTEDSTDLYYKLDQVVRKLSKETDFEVDEKEHAVTLTEAGIKRCEQLLGVENLYDEAQMRTVHHINQALRAHELYRIDVEYMIKDGEIIIVDEFTGRLMPGRRWSDGLHQAIEAKERVEIRQENQTLATVTFQNYFRMYEKLAGMTGTALTEAPEFNTIYSLDVLSIPTNRPMSRKNYPDVVYKTEEEKFVAVVQEIVDLYSAGQPVLIGTISIEKSERLSRMLKEPSHLLKRLGTVAQWALNEVKKEPVKPELRQQIEQALARPAMLSESQVAPIRDALKQADEKSILTYRFEEILRLVKANVIIKKGLAHNVLNAKYHEQEARIIAQAGRKGAVTIATNMAGRGTDILLGGNPQALAEDVIREEETQRQAPLSDDEKRVIYERFKAQNDAEHDEVVKLGGLHVLGTERHEARRIDNQLRGRSGRQGDPGSSRFYLSLADDLMRIFGSDRIAKLMDFKWFQWEEGLPIEHGMVSKAIETSQKRVEAHNFDIRKQLLEYDNTMNRQREVIYEQRRRILDGVALGGLVKDIIAEVSDDMLNVFAPKEQRQDMWDFKGLADAALRQFALTVDPAGFSNGGREAVYEQLTEAFEKAYEDKRKNVGPEMMAHLERSVMLSIMDAKWKDHLYMMDSLREGIHLRAYGQRDPIVEYQREAYQMFQDMTTAIKVETLTMLLRVQPTAQAEPVSVFARTPQKESHPEISTELVRRVAPPQAAGQAVGPLIPELVPGRPQANAQPATLRHEGPKVGRNDPCPCGSGQKYKKCHGK